MFEIIIAAIVGVFVGGMIGTTIMALLSFRKLTEYEEEIPELRRRLIDADAYTDKHEECGWLDDITVDEFNAITPTIIEAEE